MIPSEKWMWTMTGNYPKMRFEIHACYFLSPSRLCVKYCTCSLPHLETFIDFFPLHCRWKSFWRKNLRNMDTHPMTRITMWWWKTFFKLKTKIKMVLYLRENLSTSMMNSNCRHHLFLNILFFHEWVMFCLWFWLTSVFCFSSFIQYWARSIIYCFPFSCTANVSLDLCLSIGLKKYFNKGFQKKKKGNNVFLCFLFMCVCCMCLVLSLEGTADLCDSSDLLLNLDQISKQNSNNVASALKALSYRLQIITLMPSGVRAEKWWSLEGKNSQSYNWPARHSVLYFPLQVNES